MGGRGTEAIVAEKGRDSGETFCGAVSSMDECLGDPSVDWWQ